MKSFVYGKITKPLLLLSPSISVLLFLFILPCIKLIRTSFSAEGGKSGYGIGNLEQSKNTWSFEVYHNLLSDHFFWELFFFTVKLGMIVTAICMVLGFITAHFLWQLPKRWKAIGLACVVIPKLSSLLITIFGLKLILADTGPLNRAWQLLPWVDQPLPLQHSMTGVVISKTILILPYTILIIWTGLERIDKSLLPAAKGLSARRYHVLKEITLPLSYASLGSAALVSLIWALGAFVSPYLVGSPQEITLAVDVQRQMFDNLNWSRGAAEGVMLILTIMFCCIACLGFARTYTKRKLKAA